MSAPRAAGVAVLSVFALLLLRFSASPVAGTGGDVPIYLLTAHWLSPHTGVSAAAEHAARHSLFPPLYPLLLGLLAGADVAWARAVTALCLPLAAWASYAWARATGKGAREAAALATGFALLPGTWLASQEQLSEPLYLAISVGALACAARSGGRPGAWLFAAAGLCGLAPITRSIGFALAIAFSLWLLRGGAASRRQRWLYLAPAWGPALAWAGIRWSAEIGSQYGDVFESRLGLFGSEPARAVAGIAAAELAALAGSATRIFSLFPSGVERALAAAVALLASCGVALRLRRGELDALYLAAYLLVLLFWPFPAHAERFLHAVSPLWLLHAHAGLGVLARRSNRVAAPRLQALLLGLCLALPLPSLLFIASRHREGGARAYADYTHTPRWYTRRALAQAEFDAVMRRDEALAMRRVRELVPASACVFAVKPLELMLHADRVSRLPPPEGLPVSDTEAALAACDYVFAQPLVMFPYRVAFHPVPLLGERFEPIEAIEASREAGGRRAPPSAVIGRIRRGGSSAAPASGRDAAGGPGA